MVYHSYLVKSETKIALTLIESLVVECLPSMLEALGLIPSTANKTGNLVGHSKYFVIFKTSCHSLQKKYGLR